MTPAGLAFFARHEARLAGRDLAGLLWRRRNRRRVFAIAGLATVYAALHLLAYGLVAEPLRRGIVPDGPTLAVVGVALALTFCLLLSQAIESVTRAFYARGDLELVLASPAASEPLFAVRMMAIAAQSALMAALLASPLVHVLVILDGPRWLGVHAVLAAGGAAATALGLGIAAGLFRLIGPARTRGVAQVVAAIVGAAFAIALQAVAILSWGDPSRFAALDAPSVRALLPGPDSLVWLPVRALLGDGAALLAVGAVALLMLGAAIAVVAPRFGADALAVASAASRTSRPRSASTRFRRQRSPGHALRSKEWALLRRDPWLLSQTLMQILYLIPAALLLWQSFGTDHGRVLLLVPVLVMAAGQLAGGLAWLAVSGEDAPDLIGSAPVPPRVVVRAKVEAVLGAVGLVSAPLLAGVAALSPPTALVAAAGIAAASVGATAIQLWFRTGARRSAFSRRQTASRVATFAEAFSSIGWACTAAIAAQGAWVPAAVCAALVLLILAGVRALAPRGR